VRSTAANLAIDRKRKIGREWMLACERSRCVVVSRIGWMTIVCRGSGFRVG